MVPDGLSEGRIEVPVIQEDVRIMKPPIEMPLHGLDGLYDTFQLLIPCQDHKYRVRSSPIGLRFEAASHKDFVVFLADFSTS